MGGVRLQVRVPASKSAGVFWTASVIALAGLPAIAQDPLYSNKLAPYVSSPTKVVDRMLELANIRPGETVYDLGCGDGRILIAAVKNYKAKAVGVEISPKLAAEATDRIRRAGLAADARVIQGDLLKADFAGADVVTIYLATSLNAELRPRMEKLLKPGARVVSHDYAVPGWKPSKVEEEEGKHLIYLYEMPPAKK
ncbi:MAG TPA: methyltransferase domain-containing protein [Bryobacteraceae bacterium]|jgi:SAM-dependent methyltransferase